MSVLARSFDPDQPDPAPRAGRFGDPLDSAAFAVFCADARDTPAVWNKRAGRPETKEEAFFRRWREIPEANRCRYRRLVTVGMDEFFARGGSR